MFFFSFLDVFCYIFWVDSQSQHLLSRVRVCMLLKASLCLSATVSAGRQFHRLSPAICQCPCSAPPKESRQSDQKQQTTLEHSGAHTNYTWHVNWFVPNTATLSHLLLIDIQWLLRAVQPERAQMINASDWMALMSHWWVLMTMTVIMQPWWQRTKGDDGNSISDDSDVVILLHKTA